ncbi:hypothetical protein F0562_034016 [Nyssa sinensis]|uniref:Uncharacterized protein n=1 Tax=Nyssa sinensis TaxID=561372 RepID=A0A5J5ADT9_9ASTE|nr:hypothetical protein F0562_034016 [Nyssa sinensis]
MSSDVVDKTKPLGKDIVFDDSDDETGNEYSGVPLLRTHDMVLDRLEASGGELYHASHNQFPLKSQAGLKVESGPGNSKAHLAEGSKMQMAAAFKHRQHRIWALRSL